MPKPALTRFSTLQVSNPNLQGSADLAPSDLPELIVPQVTTDQADALPHLQNGMIVYDVLDGTFKFRQDGAWVLLGEDGDVTGSGKSVPGNITTFADEDAKVIQDSGLAAADVKAILQKDEEELQSQPQQNTLTSYSLTNLSHIHFVNGVGIILVDDLMPLEFLTNSYGSDPGDIHVCTLFTGDLPGSSTTPSALVELQSTTGALLLSRMTTDQRMALHATNGMMVYDVTLNQFFLYQNNVWETPGRISSPAVTKVGNLAFWQDETGTSLGTNDGVYLAANDLYLNQGALHCEATLSNFVYIAQHGYLEFDVSTGGVRLSVNGPDAYYNYVLPDKGPSSANQALIASSLQQANTTFLGWASFAFPDTNGSQGQFLSTDGSGKTSWATVGGVAGPAATLQNGLALWGDKAGKSLLNSSFAGGSNGNVNVTLEKFMNGNLADPQLCFRSDETGSLYAIGADTTIASWVPANSNVFRIPRNAGTTQGQILTLRDASTQGTDWFLLKGTDNMLSVTYKDPTYSSSYNPGTLTLSLPWLTSATSTELVMKTALVIDNASINDLMTPYIYTNQGAGGTWKTSGASSTAAALLVSGDIIIHSSYSLFISSSAQYKKILSSQEKAEEEALESFKKIPFHKYEYKDKVKKGAAPYFGVIAEELSAVFPQLVATDHHDFVPNILQKARGESAEQRGGSIHLTFEAPLEENVREGKELMLYTGEKKITVPIKKRISPSCLVLSSSEPLPVDVFVYGTKEVTPVVDKERLFETGLVVLQNVLRRLEHIEQNMMH